MIGQDIKGFVGTLKGRDLDDVRYVCSESLEKWEKALVCVEKQGPSDLEYIRDLSNACALCSLFSCRECPLHVGAKDCFERGTYEKIFVYLYAEPNDLSEELL